jgi:hypothetical protein
VSSILVLVRVLVDEDYDKRHRVGVVVNTNITVLDQRPAKPAS